MITKQELQQAQNKAPLMSEGLLSPFQVSNMGKREKKELDKLGKKGDTYEDIIWKLCSTKREVSELK